METTTHATKQDFFQALRSCPKPDVLCRINRVNAFGLSGIRDTLVNWPNRPNPPDNGPSFTVIEKAMNFVLKTIGKVLGKQFQWTVKGFKLIYKPHFKLLKMFDKAFERYWDSISFLTWSLTILCELPPRIRYYCKTTGTFDATKVNLALFKLGQQTAYKRIDELQLAAAVLAQFDKMLLEDLEELFLVMLEGLKKTLEVDAPKTVPDKIALTRLQQDLTFMWFKVDKELFSCIRQLAKHAQSWHSVNNSTAWIPEQQHLLDQAKKVQRNSRKALDSIQRKLNFGG